MLKRFYAWCLHAKEQFIRYAVVGASGFVVDFGLLILFKEVFGMNPALAVATSQILVVFYIFFLNKYWSFKNHHMPHWQFVRFVMLACWNYIFATSMMYVFANRGEFDYRLVRLVSVIISILWNFYLYKHWVYKEKCLT